MAFTLVDITDTGMTRIRDANTKEYHQQQNLNVLLQTIGMRTQVLEPMVRIHHGVPANRYFSEFFGDADVTMWELFFQIEHNNVWLYREDPLALLKDDVHGVAITSDLDNSVEFPVNIFDTKDNVNTYFVTS